MLWMWFCCLNAFAGSLEGVTLPDTATVGGQPVVLNGLGLREKFYINVYVGGLYLPAKTTDSAKAINDDVVKRIVMHFTYGSVPKDKINETFDESFGNQGAAGTAQSANKEKLKAMMVDLVAHDEVVFEYVPGTGTTIFVKGVNKGTIPGVDFMKTLFSVYVGPNPPTSALKSGMMSGN